MIFLIMPGRTRTTYLSSDLGVAAREFDLDRRKSKVRTHREVGNSCSEDDRRSEVVEDAVVTRFAHREAHECEAGYRHHGADGKVPV